VSEDNSGFLIGTMVPEACRMVVKRSQTAQGHAGEQLHVRGPLMEMRVWENVPRGYHFAPHDCAVDIAGYITQGSGLWLINGQEYITSAGDSYYLPAGSMYGLTVLEELSAVEVLSPPLQDC
jgi:quercetin dioxygenase-like cupin family protein